MMERTIQNTGADVFAEQGEGENAKTVLRHTDEESPENNQGTVHSGSEEELRQHKSRDHKNRAGADATAFLGNFDLDLREGKQQSLASHRDAKDSEEGVGGIGRAMLEYDNHPAYGLFGKWDCEQQQQQRKPRAHGTLPPMDQNKERNHKTEKEQDAEGQAVVGNAYNDSPV